MWTVEKITELCVEYCNKCNVTFNSYVKINGRLTRVLGRCFYTRRGDVICPNEIEFSRKFIENADDQSIKEVIAHECAHYVTAALTHEHHGHDSIFKYYCHMIGTTNDGTVYNNVKYKEPDKIYKYTIYCKKCGKLVNWKSRACDVTKHPEDYFSSCCNDDIIVHQNW